MRERGTQAVETAPHTLLGRLRIPAAAYGSQPAPRSGPFRACDEVVSYRTVGERVAGIQGRKGSRALWRSGKATTMKRRPPTRRLASAPRAGMTSGRASGGRAQAASQQAQRDTLIRAGAGGDQHRPI